MLLFHQATECIIKQSSHPDHCLVFISYQLFLIEAGVRVVEAARSGLELGIMLTISGKKLKYLKLEISRRM